MANGIYIGDKNDNAREIATKLLIGDKNNKARVITNILVGDRTNRARLVYSAIQDFPPVPDEPIYPDEPAYPDNPKNTVGTLEVGSSVYMNVNGVPTEFLVVHQGNPDTAIYDSSCDGTWLLMKYAHDTTTFNTGPYHYGSSDMHNYLNNQFINYLDGNIQSIIKQVKIPHSVSTGVLTGTEGLSTKIFLLSGREVGWDNVHLSIPNDGVCLGYFSNNTAARRTTFFEGNPIYWWTRTIPSEFLNTVPIGFCITKYGECGAMDTGTQNFLMTRPALILPSDTLVDENGNIVTENT